ncbi:MAG TPA: hypothetical protein VNH64_00505 [Parvularculaceae bacterium]|nr:hypothetical protein [Parvularculaceae bacterium]
MRLSKIPFAVFLTIAIAVIAGATGAWTHRLSPDLYDRFGYSTRDLWDGRPWTLLTAIFLTGRPAMTWIIIFFAPVSIGVYEWLVGTRRALFVFFFGDLAATLAVSLLVILPLQLAGVGLGAEMEASRDVGMSAGGFAAMGGVIALAPGRWRLGLIAVVFALIALKTSFVPELVADLVHVFGVSLGFGAQRWLARKTP